MGEKRSAETGGLSSLGPACPSGLIQSGPPIDRPRSPGIHRDHVPQSTPSGRDPRRQDHRPANAHTLSPRHRNPRRSPRWLPLLALRGPETMRRHCAEHLPTRRSDHRDDGESRRNILTLEHTKRSRQWQPKHAQSRHRSRASSRAAHSH